MPGDGSEIIKFEFFLTIFLGEEDYLLSLFFETYPIDYLIDYLVLFPPFLLPKEAISSLFSCALLYYNNLRLKKNFLIENYKIKNINCNKIEILH